MFEDVYNVYNGFKPLHSSSNSEPLRKAILRARTVVHGFDDMPSHKKGSMFLLPKQQWKGPLPRSLLLRGKGLPLLKDD
jgi:hypothetical protein